MRKYPKNCHSKRHRNHTYAPWFYKKPYNRACDICQKPAGWKAGKEEFIALCDCHAEDWHRYTSEGQSGYRLHSAKGSLKKVWAEVYKEFREAVLSGEFVPNDFSKEVTSES